MTLLQYSTDREGLDPIPVQKDRCQPASVKDWADARKRGVALPREDNSTPQATRQNGKRWREPVTRFAHLSRSLVSAHQWSEANDITIYTAGPSRQTPSPLHHCGHSLRLASPVMGPDNASVQVSSLRPMPHRLVPVAFWTGVHCAPFCPIVSPARPPYPLTLRAVQRLRPALKDLDTWVDRPKGR
ncbi:hypothetical protein ACOMHN_042928 [Nucella lapillus]